MPTDTRILNDDPTVPRTPRWLDNHQRAELAAVIHRHLQTRTTPPATAGRLRAVLTELDVAVARDQVWPRHTSIARLAAGHHSEAVPVRVSDSELAAVLNIADLPDSLRDALTPRKSIP